MVETIWLAEIQKKEFIRNNFFFISTKHFIFMLLQRNYNSFFYKN